MSTATLPAITRTSSGPWLSDLKLSPVTATEAASDTLQCELLLVRSTVGSGGHLSAGCSFNSVNIDAAGHVVSGQAGKSCFGVQVCSTVEQCLNGSGMFLFHGPHQGRRSPHRFLCIHVHAGGNQQLDRFRIAVASREHQQSFSRGPKAFCIRLGFQELVDNRGITVKGGHIQRCDAVAVCDIYLCACPKQQVHHFQIVFVHGPVERGRAIHLRRVHIRFLLNQGSDGRLVSLHRRIGDVASAGSKNQGGDQEKYDGCGTRYYPSHDWPDLPIFMMLHPSLLHYGPSDKALDLPDARGISRQ